MAMDEELQGRVDILEQQLRDLQDEIAIRRRQDTYIMASLGKKNLQPNITMDLMFAGNLVWNSSFEMPKEGVKPNHWTAGISSTDKAFTGHVSLKLAPAETSEQEAAAYIPVSAFTDEQIRVTFAQLGGKLKCQVLDQSGTVILSHDSNPADSWYNGRRTFTLLPGSATSVHLRFTNIDSTNAVYIDAVQVEPDVLRKWPSLYMDGPKSGAYASEAPTGGGGSGATPTLLVASSTASAKLKAAADYVCDGVNDDVEIQAAINALPKTGDFGAALGRVVLTEGIFHIGATIGASLTASDPYTHLIGSGAGSTIMRADVALPSMLGNGYSPVAAVRDLTIEGSWLADAGIDFSIDAENGLLENVEVAYCNGTGIKVGWSAANFSGQRPIISKCRAHNNGRFGFDVTYAVLTNCDAYANAVLDINTDRVGFQMGPWSTAYGCIASQNDVGFLVTGREVVVNGCFSESNMYGIKVSGASAAGAHITGNAVRYNSKDGIFLTSTNNVSVSGNHLRANNQSGFGTIYSQIRVDVCDFCSISNNSCRLAGASAKYGIQIVTGTGNWVGNNDCYDGGAQSGIANTGTNTNLNPGNRLRNGTWSTLTG